MLAIVILILSSLPIFSGCILQPKATTIKQWNVIEVDKAPNLRVEKPIRAKLLDWLLRRETKVTLAAKNAQGEWESIGEGVVPVGAYFKGQKPNNVEPAK
jgi:hypothetical protein